PAVAKRAEAESNDRAAVRVPRRRIAACAATLMNGRPGMADRKLTLPIRLSILAALATMGLKATAYLLTGSVSLLSDALESIINLVAAFFAYVALRYAARPADPSHTYGHEKIAFFSSGLEGTLIIVAAGTIIWQSVERLLAPQLLAHLGAGVLISLAATGINL